MAQPKPLAAGAFQGAIGSFRLHLEADGKSGKTVRVYTGAVLVRRRSSAPQDRHTARDEVAADDIQGWMVWLLGRYSDSYASDQYRAFSGCTRSLRSALRFGQAWQRLACQGQAFLARDGARAPAQGEAQK
jgi:hypothetical protein